MLFLSRMKQHSPPAAGQKTLNTNTNSPEFQEYKTLLNKVSRKIDKWHERTSVPDMKKGTFENDGDYVEIDNSPSKFESSSDEE